VYYQLSNLLCSKAAWYKCGFCEYTSEYAGRVVSHALNKHGKTLKNVRGRALIARARIGGSFEAVADYDYSAKGERELRILWADILLYPKSHSARKTLLCSVEQVGDWRPQ
jgi:hypothetical protein